MKTPERIWTRRCPADCGADYCDIIEDKKMTDTSTEYIKASLLKDDKWLADNGLVKMASGCHVDGLKGISTYDDCVIDSGDYEQCRYAHMGIAKEDCKYWHEIK